LFSGAQLIKLIGQPNDHHSGIFYDCQQHIAEFVSLGAGRGRFAIFLKYGDVPGSLDQMRDPRS
jgi:hypothetical protein